ncbi:MAG: metallophosphoesterase [Novosphingobium sp.]
MFRHMIIGAISCCLTACAGQTPGASGPSVLQVRVDADVPHTNVPFFDNQADFQFAIVGDRTGGHRPGVFEGALSKLNLMRPEFVISVGDQIEGYTEDRARIEQQWDEFDGFLSRLDMPYFFVAGNHDLSNPAMTKIWQERRGATYYHFIYKGVLFIALNTEDPPVPQDAATLESTHRLEAAMARAAEETQRKLLEAVRDRGAPPKLPGSVAISDSQLSYVEKVLAANRDVRWTIVLMHKPAWAYDSPAFARIETMLKDRPYTVLAGHEHYYAHDSRFGRDYIDMGTTGGIWLRDGPGRPDHIAWVTMTDKGPEFAIIRVDGIHGKEGAEASTAE